MHLLLAAVLHLTAGSVQFFYDRFVLHAERGVTVRMDGGVTMRGDAFTMDLKQNRFLLAGHVRITYPGGELQGAAASEFLDYGRLYFIPLAPQPDRWTFENGNFAAPLKGRVMPGDAFAFAATGGGKPYIISDAATIGTRAFVRFGGDFIDLANGLGAYVRAPSYYVNFSDDPHLGENSLTGATFDGTWEFAGGAGSISALHARYDTVNGAYLAFEQHVSGTRGYAVFSVNPMTSASRTFNLITALQPSPDLQLRTFSQKHDATNYGTLQLVKAFAHSSLELQQEYGYAGSLLSFRTNRNRIGSSPFFETLSYGGGYGYDGIGGAQHFVAATLQLPSFSAGEAYLNASVQRTAQWYGGMRYTNVTDGVLSLSGELRRNLLSYVSYEVQNGSIFQNYAGATTLRTLALNFTYSNGGNFSAWVLARRHDDFPRPASQAFVLPPLNVLGQQQAAHYLGEAPYDVTADVRLRINAHTSIDVQRSYYFNFLQRRWSPEFVLQVMQ